MIKSYLITDPNYYGRDLNSFSKKLNEVLSLKKPNMACFRDKEFLNYSNLAPIFIELVKNSGAKAILHSDLKLAKELKADGIHLPFNLIDLLKEAKKSGLFTIVSTHSKDEALMAESLGANAVTFSPIFHSPNKGEPVGLEKLKEITAILSIDVYALGGIITKKQISLCEEAYAKGFASIRYFLPK
ncbi:MAG: thiamine phosphate synthase [Sulfurospirillaceae bacterium]|jgi:thiamine-phosphate pyrophosphorylase|nr:thiamine phosphate synthase [Sulfurospirillaceae bacterium]